MSQQSHLPTISMVVPVYNEESVIEKILNEWTTQLSSLKLSFTLLLINDGSTDQTLNKINDWKKNNPNYSVQVVSQINQGHGASVLNGYQLALENNSPWIFQCDSDDQIEAKDFLKLWLKSSEADFILGRRLERHDPIIRLYMSKVMRALVFLIFQKRVIDPNAPFRLMKRAILLQALKKIPRHVFAPNIHLSIEATKMAAKKEIKLAIVPITHKERQTGTPSLKGIMKLTRIGLRVIKELISHRCWS